MLFIVYRVRVIINGGVLKTAQNGQKRVNWSRFDQNGLNWSRSKKKGSKWSQF
jgi:hypothetical protein